MAAATAELPEHARRYLLHLLETEQDVARDVDADAGRERLGIQFRHGDLPRLLDGCRWVFAGTLQDEWLLGRSDCSRLGLEPFGGSTSPVRPSKATVARSRPVA